MTMCKILEVLIVFQALIAFAISQGCEWSHLQFENYTQQSPGSTGKFAVTTTGTLKNVETFTWNFDGKAIARHTYFTGSNSFSPASVNIVGRTGESTITRLNDTSATIELQLTLIESDQGKILFAARDLCGGESKSNAYALNVTNCTSSSQIVDGGYINTTGLMPCDYMCSRETTCRNDASVDESVTKLTLTCQTDASWLSNGQCIAKPTCCQSASYTAGIVICVVGGVLLIAVIVVVTSKGGPDTPIIVIYVIGFTLWLIGFILCFAVPDDCNCQLNGGQIAGIVLGSIGVILALAGFIWNIINICDKKTPEGENYSLGNKG